MRFPLLHLLFSLIACLLLLTALAGCGRGESEPVPAWSQHAVWYQIFPERFRNGDPGNDPAPADMAGGWPYISPEGWRPHPWTSDWYERQPWETETGRGFYWETGLRRYGGDLQGVLDRLDYLDSLGVTALYFNPLFESPSLHKYDATMYHHIDNNFGPDPAGDRAIWEREDPGNPATWEWTAADRLFLDLVAACHERGMKVIIDGVFNHTGNTFWAFRDLQARQQDSPYADWYYIDSWDDPATDSSEFAYRGWNGVRDLPELREDAGGLVEPVADHVHAVVRRWMDPNGDGDPSDGIDGWRLDVAEKVEIAFWERFRGWVKDINPDAYLVGEIWWEDWPDNKMFNAAPWLGPAFDGVMNYRWSRAIQRFAIDRADPLDAAGFADTLQAIYRDYPWAHVLACQNLMDSHDVDRLASQIVNPDRWYDHAANPAQNRDYDVRRPNADEWARLRLIAGLQMTMPGAPMIYYGTEAGMWGGDDPDPRKPMVWPDMGYDPEVHHPFGEMRPADPVAFDSSLYNYYRRLISLRRTHPVLATGAIEFVLAGNRPGLVMFRRVDGDRRYLIVANRDGVATDSYITAGALLPDGAPLVDLLSGERFREGDPVTAGPWQIRVLTPDGGGGETR